MKADKMTIDLTDTQIKHQLDISYLLISSQFTVSQQA